MSRMVIVSASLMKLLGEAADAEMAYDPLLKKQWTDQISTSKDSMAAGGIVELKVDNDWPVAYFLLRYATAEIACKVPRIRA